MILFLPHGNCDYAIPPLVFHGTSDCGGKKALCTDDSIFFATGSGIGQVEVGIPLNSIGTGGYGDDTPACFRSDREVNSQWYYMHTYTSEKVSFKIVANSGHDLDYVIWGPFDNYVENGTCGTSLTYDNITLGTKGKLLNCGHLAGPSTLQYDTIIAGGMAPHSLEYITFNATANKYYTLLLNDISGNGLFRPIPVFGLQSDCKDLRSVFGCFLGNSSNQTGNGTWNPIVGNMVTIVFYGYLLDTRALHDMAKVVLKNSNCSTSAAIGTDRMADNLGPGNNDSAKFAEWTTSFLSSGEYSVCYQPYGQNWVSVGLPMTVYDYRVVPPIRVHIGIPDAIQTTKTGAEGLKWLDFSPRSVNFGESAKLTFSGFKVFGYADSKVKVVVSNCLETFPSVAAGGEQTLGPLRTVTFTLNDVGNYVVCFKHRLEWEPVADFLTVTTPKNVAPYFGYTSCEQFLQVSMKSACGCYYNGSNAASAIPPTTVLATNFPSASIIGTNFSSSAFSLINQGCCTVNSVSRIRSVDTDYVDWGWCSNS